MRWNVPTNILTFANQKLDKTGNTSNKLAEMIKKASDIASILIYLRSVRTNRTSNNQGQDTNSEFMNRWIRMGRNIA